MKLQGIAGKGSGKYGASVWVVRKGQQIVREYVKNIDNPKSEGQVRQRARFKLMSQVTALMSPIVQNRPIDDESIRNAFARENAGAFSWDNENSRAVVDMLGLSITSSSLGLPGLSAVVAASPLPVSLSRTPIESVDAVFYAAYGKLGDKYELAGTIMVDEAGVDHHYAGNIPYFGANVTGIVYAYGVKWTSAEVRSVYENYKADPVHSASLILQLLRNPSNATLTMTRAIEITGA